MFDVIVKEMNEDGCMIAYADDRVVVIKGMSRREFKPNGNEVIEIMGR